MANAPPHFYNSYSAIISTPTITPVMNPSAAEWRPDTNAARGDSLADPLAATPSTLDSSMPPTIFQRLTDDLATATLSFLSDVPFELDETDHKCTLTHTLPLVSKRIRSLVSEGDEMWKAGLERMITKESTWRDAAKTIYAETLSQQGQQQGVAARGNGEGNRTTYGQIGTNNNGQRIFVGVQEVDTDEDNDNDNDEMELDEDSDEEDNGDATAANDGGSDSAKSIIDKTCKALGNDGAPCTCKELFGRMVQRLRFCSPIFYMPGPVTIGESFGLHFFEPRYRLLISEVMAPYPVAFRRGDPIRLRGSGHSSYPKFIYANYSPLDRGAPAVIVEVRQCLINPNGTADVFLCPTSYIWIEDIRERPNSGALYDSRAIRMTETSTAALERQNAEEEARRMAREVAMFSAGNADSILHALLQQLNGGAEFEEDSDDDDDEDVVVVD